MEHGKEKRRDPRVPLILRVDYPGLPAAVRDATENLSASGLFIRTERELAVGQRVPLVVSFPGLLDPVEVEVEVVRVRSSASEGPPGAAVRVLDEGHRARLAALVATAKAPGHAKRDFTVLVVEDNPHVLEMYEYALKKLKTDKAAARVKVEFAPDGHVALERLRGSTKPDLVLTDLFMPVMDGFTLIEQMRGDPALADVPVLVISAGGADARTRAIEMGVDVYLQKPVQFADIMSTVRTLLHVG